MIRFLTSIAFTCILTVFILGCGGGNMAKPKDTEISVDESRTALVRLVEKSDNRALKMGLDQLKSVAPSKDEQGNVQFGRWIVDLRRRNFTVSIVADPIFEEYSGTFQRDSNGEWEARIDHETRN